MAQRIKDGSLVDGEGPDCKRCRFSEERIRPRRMEGSIINARIVIFLFFAAAAMSSCLRGPLCAKVTDTSAARLTVEFCDPGASTANDETCTKCKKSVGYIQRMEFFRPADKKMMWAVESADPMKSPKLGKVVYGVAPSGFKGKPAEALAPGDVIVFSIDTLGRTTTFLSDIKVE